jgi:hypothetical protein
MIVNTHVLNHIMNKSTVARIIVLHIYLVLGLTILFGCVSGRDLVQDKSIIVKHIDSDWAYIERVSIKQYGEEVILMGSVKRRSSGHSIVRDYLNVALSDPKRGGDSYGKYILLSRQP